MPKALTEVLTQEVSLVGRGAVNRKFALKKEASAMDEILKAVLEQEAEGEAAYKSQLEKSGVSLKGQAALAGMHRLWSAFRDEMPTELSKGFPFQSDEEDKDKEKAKAKAKAAKAGKKPDPSGAAGDEGDDGDEDDMASKKKASARKSFDIAKSDLPADVKAHFESLQKSHTEAVEKAEALAREVAVERDARLTKEFVEKAARDFGAIGPANDVGQVLKSLHGQDADLAGKVESLLKMAAARTKTAALFGERGSSGRDISSTDAWGQIVKEAEGLISKSGETPISKEMAIDLVIKRKPELYTQYLNERKGA